MTKQHFKETIEKLARIAKALGITVDELISK